MKPEGATSARDAVRAIDDLLDHFGRLSVAEVATLHAHGVKVPAQFLQQLREMRRAIREKMAR